MLLGKLGAKTADILDDDNLELVANLREKGGDLLNETVHRGLGARLEDGGECQRGSRTCWSQ